MFTAFLDDTLEQGNNMFGAQTGHRRSNRTQPALKVFQIDVPAGKKVLSKASGTKKYII